MFLLSTIAFFSVYTVLLGTIVSVGVLRQRSKEEKTCIGNGINLKGMVVLIPFRNEEGRIGPLLESIRMSESLPGEFIFINDHSDDRGVELIHETLKGYSYSILSLPDEVQGKKRALRYATEQTDSEWILTVDADVTFEKDYFSRLGQLCPADMYVLPAIMVPRRFHEHFYAIDLYLVNAVNAGLAGLARPIVASGANLLYRRSTFQRVDDFASHAHAASGDDTYLLRDFRKNASDVRLMTDPGVSISTETPQSLREFFDQRLRWIGKTGDMKDGLSTFLAVLQTLFTAGFLALLALACWHADWTYLLCLFATKSAIDMGLFLPFFYRTRCTRSWWLIPLYELIFPVYSIAILLLLVFYKPKWKGRKIYGLKQLP